MAGRLAGVDRIVTALAACRGTAPPGRIPTTADICGGPDGTHRRIEGRMEVAGPRRLEVVFPSISSVAAPWMLRVDEGDPAPTEACRGGAALGSRRPAGSGAGEPRVRRFVSRLRMTVQSAPGAR